MTEPDLILVPTANWVKHCKAFGEWPTYAQQLGDDFAPCGFYDDVSHTVYMNQAVADAWEAGEEWAGRAAVHERKHAFGLPGHPDSVLDCIQEAEQYGFDERSFSRFFRKNIGDQADHDAAIAWFNGELAKKLHVDSPPKGTHDLFGIGNAANQFVTHYLWPLVGMTMTGILTTVAQGGAMTPHALLMDVAAAVLGGLGVLFNPKGGKDQSWFISLPKVK